MVIPQFSSGITKVLPRFEWYVVDSREEDWYKFICWKVHLSICHFFKNCQYFSKTLYRTISRFVVVPCNTTGCPNHSCYACRFDNEDPWDPFNFELDKCTYCLHNQQRNKMCFNTDMKKCWFKQQKSICKAWRKLPTPSRNASQTEKSLLDCEFSLLRWKKQKLLSKSKQRTVSSIWTRYYHGITMVIPW